MGWVVVYDFVSDWFNPTDWIPLAFDVAFVVIGAFFLFRMDGGFKVVGGLFIVAGCFWGYRDARHTMETYDGLSKAHRDGSYRVAEGVVEDFRTSCDSRVGEAFRVNGVSFGYENARIRMGFSQTACDGGPIRQGLFVRIWYVDRQTGRHIIRVEIRR